MNDTTKPIASTTQECRSLGMAPIAEGSPWCGRIDFQRSYKVATTMVGMERKKENSNAAGRLMPANSPAVIVDIERDVPGNTAESTWHKPIQIAWPIDISSLSSVSLPRAKARCCERS